MAGRPRHDLVPGHDFESHLVYAGEGCSGSAAEHAGKYLAIVDSGAMLDFVEDEDRDLCGVRVIEFDTEPDRDAFLAETCRGMIRMDEAWDRD